MLRCAQFVVVVGKESVKNSVGVGVRVCVRVGFNGIDGKFVVK